MKIQKFKKIIFLIFLVGLIVNLFGCNTIKGTKEGLKKDIEAFED